MKNKVIKILSILVFLCMTMVMKSQASNLKLSTNEREILPENEIIVKIDTDKNIETATFYLKYDNTKLEYIENLTSNVTTKDYPEEGTLRVVYLDPSLQGEKQLNFKFKAKSNIEDEAKISITNLTLQFVNDSTIYTDSNLEQSVFNTSISIKQKSINMTDIRSLMIAIGLVVIIVILLIAIFNTKNKKSK